MSKQILFKLYDAFGYETTNFKKVVTAYIYENNKKVLEISLDYGVGKKQKISDIEIAYSDYIIERELIKEEKAEARREKTEEKKRYISDEKEKKFQKELTLLIRQDFKNILKEEDEEELIRKSPKKELYDEEIERIKEAKRELDKERNILKRSIVGRIRLFLKEHLIEKLQIWDDPEKEEDFVKILERMYGKSLKSLKSRSEEVNFKKFINKILKVLDTYDARTPPTEQQLLRAWMKRVQWEEETSRKERDILMDELTFTKTDERVKYYYQKSTDTNKGLKQFHYDFDKQYELTSNSEVDLKEVYSLLRSALLKEIENLYNQKELRIGKQFQIRMLIPQYNESEELVNEYTGGNGRATEKTGYGMSLPSVKFSIDAMDNYLNQLIFFMEKRLSSYLSRNMDFIHTQYVSGFMIIIEI